MRIAVAGSGRLGTSVLLPLLRSRHEVVAVVLDGRQTRGWRRGLYSLLARFFGGQHSILHQAAVHGLPKVWIDKMTEEELAPLAALSPDVLLVSGFAIILKPPLLRLPRVGCVNMHSSLLPKHRGPNPFCAAILQGETESGVTFHVMDEGIDTGAILDQTRFALGPRDTMFDVYGRACTIAGERVAAVMDAIEAQGLQGTPQDAAAATYDRKLVEADAWIDWGMRAEEIDRMVRAMSPNMMPRFRYRGRVVTVARTDFDAEPVSAAPGTVLRNRPPMRVATGAGTLILRVAFARRGVPFIFPAPWFRPKIGEVLSSGNGA